MIKIAQIGCGYWGENLTRYFSELSVLSHVVDGDPETAETTAEQYGAEVSTFDEVLANSEIQSLSFATAGLADCVTSSSCILI